MKARTIARRRGCKHLLSVSLLWLPVVGCAQEPVREEPAYPLPADPKAVVLSLDYQGGLTPPRLSEAPLVAVYADGRVVAPRRYEKGEPAQMRLRPEELQELLRVVLEEQRLLEWDPEPVKAALAASEVPMILDAPDTLIRLHLKERSFEARQSALGFFCAERFSGEEGVAKLPALHRLHATERSLLRLHATTLVGGREALEATLGRIERTRREQQPEFPAFRAEDVQGASFDGTKVRLTLERKDGGTRSFAYAVLERGKETEVSFHQTKADG